MLLSADIGWSKHFNSRYKSSHDIVILGRPKEKNEKSNCKFINIINVL
jgi:hypothetical protein